MSKKPNLTAFERMLSVLSPSWGFDRMKARHASEVLARHYEAASGGRRTTGWARSSADANLTIAPALLELRMHARDLTRNNAWAKRGQRVVANNMVGWGIVPKATGAADAVNKAADQIWKDWATSTDCESEGRHTFYGLQHLAAKSIFESGEILIRRRMRRPTDGLAVPIQMQILEADFLDHTRMAIQGAAGGPIIQGIEFDKIGRRAAYWLFDQHPNSGRNITPSRRQSADDVEHIYYSERPGQARGISWLGAAIVNMKDLDEYDDAELMKQKIAACFAAFVTDDGGGAVALGEEGADPLVETFEPGMIAQLPPGKSVTFGVPPTVTNDNLATRNLRRIAAAIGVSYEDLTGDYSQVNFSSARMSRLSHWANVHDWQENMMIPLLCQTVWGWVMEAAVLANLIPVAPKAEWTTPPMPMIEPDKEGLAYSRLVRNGTMTYSQMIREQGGDPEAHWQEYAADQARLDELGILLDSDVRAVSAAGLTQVRAGAGGDAPPAEGDAPPPKEKKAARDVTEELRERMLALERSIAGLPQSQPVADDDVSPETEAMVRKLVES